MVRVKVFSEIIPLAQAQCSDLFKNPPTHSEHKVILTKSESLNLIGTSEIRLGLGWENPGKVDLDASLVTIDEHGKHIEKIYYGNKESKDHKVKHLGDNRTGAGSGLYITLITLITLMTLITLF